MNSGIFGIKVTSVEPGAINTNIIKEGFHLAKRLQKEDPDSAFKNITNDMTNKTREMIINGAHPRLVANLIVLIANTKEPEIRYPVGEDAKKISVLKNKMTDKEFESLLKSLLNINN
jgi:NAD(P)-dependent dehydrogenase (short-subunit alcohol dehydrogenase family)